MGYRFVGVFAALIVAVLLIVVVRDVWVPDTVDVTVPQLSPLAARGEAVFRNTCADCHGKYANGSDSGPPLVHKIYRPGHHADASFVRAIRMGTRSHHWNFGDMPAQPGIDQADVPALIRFVRELQKANGVF